jgi:hypothetical protein
VFLLIQLLGIISLPIASALVKVGVGKAIPLIADACKAELAMIARPVLLESVPPPPGKRDITPEWSHEPPMLREFGDLAYTPGASLTLNR